ncbi:oligoendopeptidase F [Sinanaerobacter sp. ZZT-01]|uniref:oligoendopeptidase F n=1 Tax=Sinanaerobacter sp. ZZT-01 TaxID=3111540 RepID=UPI002D779DD6|nr:oligoendopeptidase F [Sinanaerobacter sp. ZZT-01]WRR93333.1 oligoendopeptidase F [Sinanaerobacter sp. ZZT-01]
MGDNKKTKQRSEIPQEYKWKIEAMYQDEANWDRDSESALKMAEDFKELSGKLGESADVLLQAFEKRDEIWLLTEKIYVYARMKRDEDNRISRYQAMCDKSNALIAKIAANTSFFTPELLAVSEEKIREFLGENEKLQKYTFVVDELFRLKAHVLTQQEEHILAQFSELTSATNDIFSMINNADIKFGTIRDEDGDEVEVTHGRYIGLMESPDRRVRKEAFEHMYAAYEKQKNTLATTYNYNTKADVVTARIRKYESSIKSALAGDNIPLSVYDNLIDIVNKNLPIMYRYVEIRKRMLNLDELHMYDMYTPLVEMPKEDIPYEKALEIIREALVPMGEDYLRRMNHGFASGWVDVYENEGKTSGAYSFGTYDSMPYILLNYNGRLKDVFTVIHEMGHSMHSNYTREFQPYVYGGHSIFTAEVASTVNESLLMKHLLTHAENDEIKKYILNLYIEAFRTTLFRQTMFAEFEKMTHEAVEQGEVLTAQWLSEEYGKLNQKYFGENVVYDSEIKMEWARIPHFYNAFYVYKYATGFSAAAALSDRILNEGKQAQEDYIAFLKSGESDYPINLLKLAGVDMSKTEPIEKAMQTFASLVDQLDKLVK